MENIVGSMSGSKADEIFKLCDMTIASSRLFNEQLTMALRESVPYPMDFYEDQYLAVKGLTESAARSAMDASENAGWWKKRVAKKYLQDVLTQFQFAEMGMNLLRNKLGREKGS